MTARARKTNPVPRNFRLTKPTLHAALLRAFRFNFGLLAGVGAVVLSVSALGAAPAMAAKRPPPRKRILKVAAGNACAPLGARAPGTSFDCVSVGAKTQWQPKGSKLDPYRPGEVFEWTQSTNKNAPGADIATKRIVVKEYLPDATSWVNSFPENTPEDIFAAAGGAPLRGVRVDYTLVTATDASSRNLGSLSWFWLGNDADAGCCNEGLLKWGDRPNGNIDPYSSLDDGTTQTGLMLFARTDAQLGPKPLMRLGWDDIRNNQDSYVYFAMS